MNSYSKLEFDCPICKQLLKAKGGRCECNHKGTPQEKGMFSDPDKFELDEVHVRIVTYKEGER